MSHFWRLLGGGEEERCNFFKNKRIGIRNHTWKFARKSRTAVHAKCVGEGRYPNPCVQEFCRHWSGCNATPPPTTPPTDVASVILVEPCRRYVNRVYAFTQKKLKKNKNVSFLLSLTKKRKPLHVNNFHKRGSANGL